MASAIDLSDLAVRDAYERLVSSATNQDYVLYEYVPGTDKLKVAAEGCGGLEELEEEFHDGRIQYAFVRVKDPKSGLNKFVQINWIGQGAPETRIRTSGSHANELSRVLRGAHLTISARNEDDVAPEVIMKRLAESGGAHYSAQNEVAQKPDLIRPVGSAYKPIGKPDIASLTKGHKPEAPAPVGTAYTPVRHELPNVRSSKLEAPAPVGTNYVPVRNELSNIKQSGQDRIEPVGTNYVPVRNELANIKSSKLDPIAPVGTNYVPVRNELSNVKSTISEAPAPVGTNYVPVRNELSNIKSTISEAPAPVGTNYVPVRNELSNIKSSKLEAPAPVGTNYVPARTELSDIRNSPQGKPSTDDRIGPVGTSYSPVSLPKPGKIGGRFPLDQPNNANDSVPAKAPSSGKLTWSERQALSAQQNAADEAASRAASASAKAPATASEQHGGNADLSGAKSLLNKSLYGNAPSNESADTPQPTSIKAPVTSGATAPGSSQTPATSTQADSKASDQSSEMKPVTERMANASLGQDRTAQKDGSDKGLSAKAEFDYDAEEENELSFKEGEMVSNITKPDDDWWHGTNEAGASGLFPAAYVVVQAASSTPEPSTVGGAGHHSEQSKEPEPKPAPSAASSTAPKGAMAVALYDYEADEENEVSFKEGETLSQIEETDADWWTGTNEAGQRGLFPMAYVEKK